MDKVRICIVGMGIGRSNGRALARNPRGQVVALCDLLPERMEEFASELPGPLKFYTSYEEMCQDPDIDAVFVGTPNQYHAPVGIEAAKNGKHVLVTKPLADSLEAARSLVEAAESAGVVNMMSLSTRFDPSVQYLGQLAQAGELGELYYARARSVRRIGIPAWSLGFIQKGGGAFRDMGVHVLDAIWWLLGMPTPESVLGVSGAKFGPRGEGYFGRFALPADELAKRYAADDYAGGFIRFTNGAGVQVESFWASHQPEEFQLELLGDQAGAKMRPLTIYRTVNGATQDTVIQHPLANAKDASWDKIADHFIECILDGVPCQAPLRHGLIVQEMMEGLLASADSGKEVRFGE
jgi:predicted dehydrogenase